MNPFGVKVSITDLDALNRVDPRGVESYLNHRGWNKERLAFGGKAFLWTHKDYPGQHLLVPYNSGLGDHGRRIGGIIRDLAEVEGRSELKILCEVTS